MRIGYARVSTQEQDTQAQITALTEAGCERIFQEKASGGRWDRPELHRLISQLRKGDMVVVWKLDRLSRSLKDLLLTLEKIETAGADFQSLTEAINTGTPAGRMMMQIVGSFAEFERAMLRAKTTEANLNEFGRFDALLATVEKQKAKAYFEAQEGKSILPFKVNIKAAELLRTFIIQGGFEVDVPNEKK